MSENVSTGSRVEFLARVQRFTDEMLGSLDRASHGKDEDEKGLRNSETIGDSPTIVFDTSAIIDFLRRGEKTQKTVRDSHRNVPQ